MTRRSRPKRYCKSPLPHGFIKATEFRVKLFKMLPQPPPQAHPKARRRGIVLTQI